MNPRTYFAKTGEVQRQWHMIDGDGKILGRLATKVADLLRGKGKRIFSNGRVSRLFFPVVVETSRWDVSTNRYLFTFSTFSAGSYEKKHPATAGFWRRGHHLFIHEFSRIFTNFIFLFLKAKTK